MDNFELFKVFEPHGHNVPQVIFEVVHKFAGDCYGMGNDSYCPWSIDDKDNLDGLGWLTKEESIILNDWLKENGGISGETVLIHHWW